MSMTITGPVQRYQPSELLSEDDLGTLWRGRDVRSGSPVTIRLLEERLTSDPRAVHRATAQLRWAQWEAGNPHLARVLDLGLRLEGQPAFVVSEGSAGGTLMQHLIRGESLTVRRAVQVVAAVADGLSSAHASWVYHGALTPASILLDDDCFAKVTDIGFWELLDAREDLGPSARASSLNDRGATDVLAVARLFEQLLAGGPGREGVGSDRARVWEDEIPAELGDLIRRALSPHRFHRPGMADLAAALTPALQAAEGTPIRIVPSERERPERVEPVRLAERVEPVRPTDAPRREPAGRPNVDVPIPLAPLRVPTGEILAPPPQGHRPAAAAGSEGGIAEDVTPPAPSKPTPGRPSAAPVER
ncbi:MAG: protein kinase, partial [Actinomycetota bacterium]